jgi:putative endonuclease
MTIGGAGMTIGGAGMTIGGAGMTNGGAGMTGAMYHCHPREGGGPEIGRAIRPCVYILASRRNDTLYVGVTSDLGHRAWQHRTEVVAGFTKRYGIHTLVYAEFHMTMAEAIQREKQIEKWRRAWKIRLIEEANQTWRDLYDEIG